MIRQARRCLPLLLLLLAAMSSAHGQQGLSHEQVKEAYYKSYTYEKSGNYEDAIKALQLITRDRPRLVVLGRAFTDSERGAALVNAIRTNQTLTDTRKLRNSIDFALDGQEAVEIGTNIEYASGHQFGEETGGGGLPARPFLGFDSEDEERIREIFEDILYRNAS